MADVPLLTPTAHDARDHTGITGVDGMTNPMTTQDDLIVGGASGAVSRLGKGADGQVLTVDPTTHHLKWADPAGGVGGSLPTAKEWVTDNQDPRDYPASAHAMDDEFVDNAGESGPVNGLDAKWAWRSQNGSSFSFLHAGYGSLNADSHAGDRWSFIEQTIPAGDWTFETRVEPERIDGGNAGGGIALIRSSDSAFYILAPYSEGGAPTVELFLWSNPTTWNSTQFARGQAISRAFVLRVVKSGSTYTFWYGDGVAMQRVYNSTLGIVPDRVGLGVNEQGSAGGVLKLHVDYFRKTA